MALLEKHSVYLKFCKFFKENSIELKADHLISLSGGRDSVCLFYLFVEALKQNKIKNLRAIHFNHGVRTESNEEELFVRKICEENKIDLHVVTLSMAKTGNFEQVAREKRYKKINEIIQEREMCSLGHHLDDCFEWSLMRFFRSGDNDFIKGIPKFRLPFIRPLSSISRGEIDEFIKQFNIPFVEDNSNTDIQFDRNHLRQNIIPEIKERYPNYLDFYLSRRESFLSHAYDSSKRTKLELVFKGDMCSIFFTGQKDGLRSFHADILKEEIIALSKSKRGSLTREMDKLIIAFNDGKKGPMQFSGDCFIWLDRPFLVIYKSEFLDHVRVLHTEELSSYSNRQEFVRALQEFHNLSPLLCLNINKNKHKSKLVKCSIPPCFGKGLSLENVYSLGAVYRSLPDV